MRKIYFLLFLLLYVGAASVAQHKKLRVMSYNIRIASPPSKGWGVTELDSIAAVINRHPCDLIALQEVDRFTRRSGKDSDQIAELAKRTDMHSFFAKAIDREGGDYGVGVLSRYPIVEAHAYRIFPHDTVKHEIRALAVIKVRVAKKDIIFASFHLDHLSHEVRKNQLEQVFSHLEKYKNFKIIFGADLNIHADNALLDEFSQRGFIIQKENLKTLTFSTSKPRVTLDYLIGNKKFYKNVKDVTFEVLHKENYASDHFPIILTLSY